MLQGAARKEIPMEFLSLDVTHAKRTLDENTEFMDLITQALPTTCWHKHKGVYVVQGSPTSFVLQGPKAFVAKDDNICKIDVI